MDSSSLLLARRKLARAADGVGHYAWAGYNRVVKRKAMIVVIVALAVPIVGLSLSRGRELSNRSVCCNTMRRIGTSARIYTTDATGGWAVEQLVHAGLIPKNSPICPSSGLQQGNYVIVAPPTPPINLRTVVMYEPNSNHGDGGNFLFADGHAGFIGGEKYDLLVREPTRWWKTERNEE